MAKKTLQVNWFSGGDPGPQKPGPLSLCIGNFDGVHLGHRQLIQRSLAFAAKAGGRSAVLTFFPHPAQVLRPDRPHWRVFDLDDQREQLQNLGVEALFIQKFTREFAEIPAQEFLYQHLSKTFRPDHIVVGHDFGFGKGRKGNVSMLREFCGQNGIELQALEAFKLNDKIVSTSAIRDALTEGNVEFAAQMLGRKYSLSGVVVKGDQRGRSIGFPTANLQTTVGFLPMRGVYACWAHVRDRKVAAVANIGRRPTFKAEAIDTVEAHLLDFKDDIYGIPLKLEFVNFLREEQKFSGVDMLKAQIEKDIKVARDKLGT